MDKHPEMFTSLLNTMAEYQTQGGRQQHALYNSFLATMDSIRRCSPHC